jgi:TPR repeat protein
MVRTRSVSRVCALIAATFLAFAHPHAGAAGEMAQEFGELLKEAEAGRTTAQYYLALRFLHGVGQPKDETSAVFWFEKAAAGGDAAAAFNLARLHKEGRVMLADPTRALHLLRYAVEERVPGANMELGEMLLTGSGTERAFAEAAELFHEAATLGNASAAFNLGVMHARGWGVAQDPAEAVRWYERAADGGEPNAQFNVAAAILAGSKAKEDAPRAIRLLSQAAVHGVVAGMFTLGRVYEEGTVVPANDILAFRWYRAAAANDHEGAMSNLARMLIQRGLGPEADAEAVRWLEAAAEKLDPSALFNLAVLRERGIIVEQDKAAALAAYKQSAELGFAPAQLGLAMLLASSTSRDDQLNAAAWGILAREQDAKLEGEGILERLPDTIVAEGRFKAEALRQEIARTRELREAGADVAAVLLQRVKPPKSSVNGFLISSEGLIVAPYSPIAAASEIKVRYAGALQPAAIIAVDEARDIAVLSISRKVERWLARSVDEPTDAKKVNGVWFHAPWAAVLDEPLTTPMRTVVSASPFGSEREWLALNSLWDSAAVGGVVLDGESVVGVLTGRRTLGGSVAGVANADASEFGVALRATFIEGLVKRAGGTWPAAVGESSPRNSVAGAMVVVLGF